MSTTPAIDGAQNRGVVLRGGTVVDGTGAPAVAVDVRIADGLITDVGTIESRPGDDVVDVSGLIVAPGFVDIHSHSDLSILGHPAATGAVLQGVTTDVVGNCGLGVVPLRALSVVDQLRPLMTYCDDPSIAWDWTSVREYRERVDAVAPNIGIEVLTGHNAVRGSVVGMDDRPARADELAQMSALLDDALTQGAVGMSLGLMYPPSQYADIEEFIALGRVLAAHDAVLASHMADYGAGLQAAVADMIRVGEESGCRVQISHLAVVGEENWGGVVGALALIDAARERGVDVAADFYPYLAGSTNLSQSLPQWALAGGSDELHRRLTDQETRASIRSEMSHKDFGTYLLVAVASDPDLQGLRVPEAAAQRGQAPVDLVLELLTDGDPTIVAFGRSEEDLRTVMRHPHTMLGSDGVAVDTFGSLGGPSPHPRFFGAFPSLFHHYVRENPVLTLEEAVRKCTSMPAERVRLTDRGRIAPGLRADLVVFDLGTIEDRSDYADSRRVPAGIRYVIRGGREIARDGVVVPVTA